MNRKIKVTSIGDDLVESMQEALAHARGKKSGARVTRFDDGVEVKRIRERMGLTQSDFATVLGTSVSGLRKWEQAQRQPQGSARTLLKVMDKEPEAVLRALAKG
jgi:putative transcriptional regulator